MMFVQIFNAIGSCIRAICGPNGSNTYRNNIALEGGYNWDLDTGAYSLPQRDSRRQIKTKEKLSR